MINKKGLWFLTLFSLILVLSIYYITMPDEMLKSENINISDNSNKNKNNDEKESKKSKEVNGENTSYIETLKIELDSERANSIENLKSVMSDKSKSLDEKNKAYEQIKVINNYKAKEENISKKIKDNFNLESYVKQTDNKVEVVINSKKHDVKLANKIIRSVQEEYEEFMQISVKFS